MKILQILFLTLFSLSAFAQSGGPTYSIATIRGNNAVDGGVADSVNIKCKVVGVVYGNNFRASNNGIQFSLRDATGSIGLFKDATNFGLNLQEGDSIRAIGKVTAFNGLSQIDLDSVKVLGTNRPLKQPEVITSLNEATESKLVKLVGWQILNPAFWTTGQGSGFTVRVYKATDTMDLRIDNDCPWFNQPVPTGVLDIIGIGGQFDGSVPRNSGYQFLPRRLADIYAQGTTVKAFFPSNTIATSEAGGSVSVPVNLNIVSTASISFRAFVKSAQATAGTDYTFSNPATLTFAPGQTTGSFSVTILDDATPELPESITLVLRRGIGMPDGLIGNDSILELNIIDNDGGAGLIKTYSIGTVRGNNSLGGGGLPDSLGKFCRLRGVVYGQNLRGAQPGHQFTMRDNTGGIGLFTTNTLFPDLAEGDSVSAVGKIEHFQGYAIIRVDSMRRIAVGRPLKTPTVITGLNEQTESDLIRLLGFQLVNPAEWTTGVGTSGFTARIFKGNDTINLRVDNNLSLFFDPAPVGVFNVTGLGSQFDSNSPYTSGYEIMPRGSGDIQLVSSNPQAIFSQTVVSGNESAGVIQVPVKLLGASANPIQVRLVIKGGTASTGADFVITSSPTLTFAPGVVTGSTSITILDDATQETDETIILALRSINGSLIGADSIFTITITDNDQPGAFVPTYNIGTIRGNNSIEGGVADSLNVSCKIQGTLYGYNLRGLNNGIQFTIKDATGGINIFKSSVNFGLTLQEGDSIRAIGKVNQFNGLSQLNLDSVFVLATGRPLQTSVPVDSLSELTESNLVTITGFQIVNPAQWATGIGTGFTVQVSNGTRNIDLRIDNDCELFNQPVPTTQIISITGVGGQFDSSIPRNSGFQLLPRKASDIVLNTSVSTAEKRNRLTFFPNPTTGAVRLLIPHELKSVSGELHLYNSQGKEIMVSMGDSDVWNKEVSTYLSSAPAGIFMAKIKVGNDSFQSTLIKQ
jgi:DNA/RNA endonuclease YhcR with UshA esterase domain